MRLYLVVILIIIFASNSCNQEPNNSKKMKIDKFEKKLIDIAYPGLFMYGSKSLADSVWNNGNNLAKLEKLIESKNSSLHSKFLAAEILRHFEIKAKAKHYDILSEAYTYALANSSIYKEGFIQLNGNLWGFLYEMDDTGYLGKQLIKYGDRCIPGLVKLLNDDNIVLYEGSKEATIGNSYQYRIKDIAAFYIAKIKNITINYYKDFEDRDKEIERLKAMLKTD